MIEENDAKDLTGRVFRRSGAWARVLASLVPLLFVLAPTAPLAASSAAPSTGPVLCQTLADGYAAQQARDANLPALFSEPFSFREMDWAPDADAKAVNVLKQQYYAEIPGMVGAFYCLADGSIKEVITCAETTKVDGKRPALDRLRRVAAAFFATIGAPDDALSNFDGAVDAVAGIGDANTGAPGGFVRLGGEIYAFVTGQDGAVCMTISQTPKSGAK